MDKLELTGRFKNHTGEKFGRLTAISFAKHEKGKTFWLFKCDCGNMCIIRIDKSRVKHTKSCGCLNIEVSKSKAYVHGDSCNRLYKIWAAMKTRCNNPNNPEYHCYGGRGISVCSEWNNYINFKKWAFESGYTVNLTIDRIDNDGNYEPSNCQWLTKADNTKKAIRQKMERK